MVMCFAPTCKHYSEDQGCKFFVFPKDSNELKRWVKLIRRKDKGPTKHSRICHCHFVDGDRKNGPTIFDYNVEKQFKSEPKTKRQKVISVGIPDVSQPGPSGLQTGVSEWVPQPEDTEEASDDDMVPDEEGSIIFFSDVAEVVQQEATEEEATQQPPQQFVAMLEADNYFLQQQVETLQSEMQKLSLSFSFKHIENNPHLISVYTGLPTKETFLALFSLFENLPLNYYNKWQVTKIDKIDQLLLTLMKLRLNLLNDDLGFRFNVSRETVANIFKTWLFALHEILFKQLMEKMPSRSKNKMCMPTSFSSFTNCRVIIDCTEMTTIRPTNMENQRVTYSSYKHRSTLKGLVGVAPNGVVTFVSKLYPGSTSDKKITIHCGITEKLVSGDLVLADKGFLISDVLPQGVSLNVPPFLTTPQFTREQVIRTRTIAKARIHVERAIQRIKSYKILSVCGTDESTFSINQRSGNNV